MKKKRLYKIFWRDVFGATVFTWLVIVISDITLQKLPVFKPTYLFLSDFDFLDIPYSKMGLSNYVWGAKEHRVIKEPDIIVVNVGNDNRSQIAEKIGVLRRWKARVIALDVTFPKKNEYKPEQDSLLISAVNSTPNLVLATELIYPKTDDHGTDNDVRIAPSIFRQPGKEGFINFKGAKEVNTVRYFAPRLITAANDTLLSFSARIVQKYDKHAFDDLMRRDKNFEIIRYLGNDSLFIIFDSKRVCLNSPDSDYIKGKIVLLGFCKTDSESLTDYTDKHFTPLNAEYTGRSMPDMYGVLIHANIISMIINKRYVTELNIYFTLLVSFFICFFMLAIFNYYFVHHHHLFHLIASVFEVLSPLVIFIFSIFLYFICSIKIDVLSLVVPFELGLPLLYFYEMIVVKLNKKWRYKTYFLNGPHRKNTSHGHS